MHHKDSSVFMEKSRHKPPVVRISYKIKNHTMARSQMSSNTRFTHILQEYFHWPNMLGSLAKLGVRKAHTWKYSPNDLSTCHSQVNGFRIEVLKPPTCF